jgi:nitrite reductase (NO-forming)
MKKIKLNTLTAFALSLFFLLQYSVQSCPKCNTSFYDELYGERKNTIAGQELIAAITNQSNGLQPSGFVVNTTKTVITPYTQQQSNNPLTGDFIEVYNRDNNLSIPPTSYVPQDMTPTVQVSIELSEGEAYIGKGVMFKGFTTNGSIPGKTIIVNEGDIVEFTVINKGTIPHGASIHSAYTQTSKYLGKIPAGESRKMVFKVTQPGVYMYHCAPGGHAIPMHVIFGQYGMMVVKPKQQYKMEQILNKKPDVEIYLLQHELYASGRDAVEGKSIYSMFNGKLFRYVEEPVKAKPGDFVRIYYLNVGPNNVSTFHIVGILWDYVYWQGHPDKPQSGGQTVLSGPSDSWVIEFRMPPDEGAFLMLDHVVGNADRGAIGILQCTKDAVTPVSILADGPVYTDAEKNEMKSKILRTVSPFEPGTPDVDPVAVYGSEIKEVTVKIIGNSYYPKTIKVNPGTKVKWVNEDVFTYMEGEFAGVHNVATYESPEPVTSPLLGHTESFEHEFTAEGEYKYMCTPHPYMRGVVIVEETGAGSTTVSSSLIIILSIISFVILIVLLVILNSIRKKYK